MVSRLTTACAAVAALGFAARGLEAFLMPTAGRASAPEALTALPSQQDGATSSMPSFGLAAMGLCVGAHVGLAIAARTRTARKAEAAEAPAPAKYVESAKDARLFEQVFLEYTKEYLKGPMYLGDDKIQGGGFVYAPGEPLTKNNQPTSYTLGIWKNFSSNELAFISMLMFGIGLYGNLQFLFFDPQIPIMDKGGLANASYIIESIFLPWSFFVHTACYTQRIQGK